MPVNWNCKHAQDEHHDGRWLGDRNVCRGARSDASSSPEIAAPNVVIALVEDRAETVAPNHVIGVVDFFVEIEVAGKAGFDGDAGEEHALLDAVIGGHIESIEAAVVCDAYFGERLVEEVRRQINLL